MPANIPLRHELKFFINQGQYTLLSNALDHVLQRDPNGDENNEYHIRSLYFDTINDDALTEKIMEIAMLRKAGDSCKTSYVEVLLKPGATADAAPTVVWAYREDCYLVPQSVGGDTTGIQIPFELHRAGNRVKGTFDLTTKKFTENGL